MVTWWWIHGLEQVHLLKDSIPAERFNASIRMMFWEGAVLVLAVAAGGGALIWLVSQERKRHEQMKLFFSNFAHDLNTAMTRLRLQCDVLREENGDASLQRLSESLNRLDLQLENSLWLAREDRQPFLKEKLKLSDLVSSLRMDCPEMEIRLAREAWLQADSSALRSVLRNLVNNSLIHGEATLVSIDVEAGTSPGRVRLRVKDNGKGYQGRRELLGRHLLQPKVGHGNGLGLYLCRRILERMNGQMQILSEQGGFQLWLDLPGGQPG